VKTQYRSFPVPRLGSFQRQAAGIAPPGVEDPLRSRAPPPGKLPNDSRTTAPDVPRARLGHSSRRALR
jgi:hypothetical protein